MHDPAFDPHEEFRAALALKHTPGLGARTWKALVDTFGSLTEACTRACDWVALGAARKRQADAFLGRSWIEPANEEYAAVRRARLHYLTCFDPRYPRLLREICDPPLVLYAKGRLELLQGPCLAVVGARKSSSYGLGAARRISGELSHCGVTIVSGLAAGIDRQAHLGGLSGPGSSIGVAGTGLDVVYPSTNKDLWDTLAGKGLVISEYPPGTPGDPRHFPVRNRIISGISLGVLVAEAASKSGSLITAGLAMDQGREVFALPGRIDEPTFCGCNELISQGAHVALSAEQIIAELRYQFSADLVQELGPSGSFSSRPAQVHAPAGREQGALENMDESERLLVEPMLAAGKLHLDELARRAGLESPEASRRLVLMEMKGLVRQWPGMYYSVA